jgi:FtsH-binding integral membrane protein
METSLFVKVCILLTGAMVCGGIGAYFGRFVQSLAAFIGLFIAAIAGIFITMAVASVNAGAGVACLMVWTGIMGMMVGPALQHYSETLGWHTVFGATLGTGGVMAICGIIGGLSGINFAPLGSVLGFALIGLILFGLVSMFVRMSRTVSMWHSVIGMVVFAGYFMFDFWRLSKAENTWQRAIELTMSIYLDFLNFLLYLLQFLESSKKSASVVGETIQVALVQGGDHLVSFAASAQPVLSMVGLA